MKIKKYIFPILTVGACMLASLVTGVWLQKHHTFREIRRATWPDMVKELPPVVPWSTLAGKTNVFVIMVGGQSTAANSCEKRYQPTNSHVLTLYNGNLYRAEDPFLGTSGVGGTVWSRLGDRLMAKGKYDTIIFIATAIGNTSVSDWSPSGGYFYPMIEHGIWDSQRAGLTINCFLWQQGEKDAELMTSPGEYTYYLNDIIRHVRQSGVKAPFFVAIDSLSSDTQLGETFDPKIREAQLDVIGEKDIAGGPVVSGPDTDTLDDTCRSAKDHLHYNGLGTDKVAGMWLDIFLRADLPGAPAPAKIGMLSSSPMEGPASITRQ